VLDAFGVQVPLLVNVVTVGAIGMLPVTVGSVSVPVLTMVPMMGLVSVGPVPRTTAPLPVLVVAPVPPCATGSALANVTPVDVTVSCVTPAP
jgi:hypothetical protein